MKTQIERAYESANRYFAEHPRAQRYSVTIDREYWFGRDRQTGKAELRRSVYYGAAGRDSPSWDAGR